MDGEWLLVFLLGAAGIGFLFFYASSSIQAGFYLKALCRGKGKERVVALTFDDGPDPEHTPEVLDVLKRYEVPATFFCIGSKAEALPDLVRRICSDGHIIGNHSYTHTGFFPLYGLERMLNDLSRSHTCLERITGKAVTWFRPPFGVTNPTVASAVKRMGYRTIGWSIRSFDTREESEERIFRRITRQLAPGAVILLHDRLAGSAALLQRLLEYLQAHQYQVVSIAEMFKIEPYET